MDILEEKVRLVMLKNGTQLITKVDSLGTTFTDPFIIQPTPTPQGGVTASFIALLLFSSETTVTLKPDDIMFQVLSEKDLEKQYNGIVVKYRAKKAGLVSANDVDMRNLTQNKRK